VGAVIRDQQFERIRRMMGHLDEEQATGRKFAAQFLEHADGIDDVLEHVNHRDHVERTGHGLDGAHVERLRVWDRLDLGPVLRVEFCARLRPARSHLPEGADRGPVSAAHVEHPAGGPEIGMGSECVEQFDGPRCRQARRLLEHRLLGTGRLMIDRVGPVDLVDLPEKRGVGGLLHGAARPAHAEAAARRPCPAV
jgi:hypothetical protein